MATSEMTSLMGTAHTPTGNENSRPDYVSKKKKGLFAAPGQKHISHFSSITTFLYSVSFLDIHNGSVYTFSLVHVNLLSIWAHGTQFLFTLRPQSRQKKHKGFSLFAETNRGQGTAKAIQKVSGGHGHRVQGSRIFL